MGGDAAWQCEGKSHLAEQFPHTACSFCFILPEEIIFREIALLSNYSVSVLVLHHRPTITSDAETEGLPRRVDIYFLVIDNNSGKPTSLHFKHFYFNFMT